MNLLLVGATGGIGRACARALHQAGHRLLLSAQDADSLQQLADSLQGGAEVRTLALDLCQPDYLPALVEAAQAFEVQGLLYAAGYNRFALLADLPAAISARIVHLNTLAPIQITQALLPLLRQQPQARLLYLGSVFGGLGYPGFSVYSASKFGLRGFTEALRRELADTRIRVQYLAPRAVKTDFNSPQVLALHQATGTQSDPPERVAQALIALLDSGAAERVLGWPERLFYLLNRICPRLVDLALKGQLPLIKQHARPAPCTPPIAPKEEPTHATLD